MEVIAKLEAGCEALVTALDRQDADAIIDATDAIHLAVIDAETANAWIGKPVVVQELIGLSKLLDISRSKVKILTVINRHRVIKLA